MNDNDNRNQETDVKNENSDFSNPNDSITTDENKSIEVNESNVKIEAIELKVSKESSNENFECDMCGKIFLQKHLLKVSLILL